MLVKVCGITDKKQYEQLIDLGIDMVGFNFYPPSKRYLSEKIAHDHKQRTLRVGVFVDPTEEEVDKAVQEHSLDMVQLHGHEPVEFCARLSRKYNLIKVFGISGSFDFASILPYEDYVQYFLFDTKTALYGGSGRKFDWANLSEYKGSREFLLSGGINPGDAEVILQLNFDKLAGVDINSGFEMAPGIKNMELIKQFLSLIKR